MTIWGSIKRGVLIGFLNEQKIDEAAKDPACTIHGLEILAMAGAASALGYLAFGDIMPGIIATLIGFFILYSFFNFAAKMLGGKAKGVEFFRAIASAYVLYFLVAIPYINIYASFVMGFWLMFVSMYVIKKLHGLSMGKSILAVVVPFILTTMALSFFMLSMGLSLTGG